MNKSDFLKEISSLSRDEIQKKLLEGSVNKKKIQPVIVTPITTTKKQKKKKNE